MPRQDLMQLIMNQFDERSTMSLEELVSAVRDTDRTGISISEIKSAVLALLRRDELTLSRDFRLRAPGRAAA